jgi:hypothetical protein
MFEHAIEVKKLNFRLIKASFKFIILIAAAYQNEKNATDGVFFLG